jgi:hypothetical protein
MVEVGALVNVPTLNDRIASQYSEDVTLPGNRAWMRCFRRSPAARDRSIKNT